MAGAGLRAAGAGLTMGRENPITTNGGDFMNLEIISRPAHTGTSNPPILLLHGAWHGAWCWESNFLDYFPTHGWDTYAMSLRGHGASEGKEKLRWASIADYVADLDKVVSSMDQKPILIGHSMGGFIVQKYLESKTVAGAVLLASIPPGGTLGFSLRILRRHPLVWLTMNLTMRLYPVVGTPELAREWFFSPDIPDEDLKQHFSRLQDESYRMVLDTLVLNRPDPGKVTTPLAVLGGASDRIFTVPEVRATAEAYGTQAGIFPGMAHNMMSERGWEDVAEWVNTWAQSLVKCQ